MGIFSFAVPIRPGKEERNRQFAREVMGQRRDEALAIRRKAGVDHERVFMQTTPNGSLAIVVWDTKDGQRALQTMVSADDAFSRWFREQLADIHGIDFSDQSVLPRPQLLAEWSDKGYAPGSVDTCWAMAEPLGDKSDRFRAFVREMVSGSQMQGFVETRRLLGVKRQALTLLDTPMGAFAIPYVEGPGAQTAFNTSLKHEHPFFAWWRATIAELSGGKLPAEAPKVEKIMDLSIAQPPPSPEAGARGAEATAHGRRR